MVSYKSCGVEVLETAGLEVFMARIRNVEFGVL